MGDKFLVRSVSDKHSFDEASIVKHESKGPLSEQAVRYPNSFNWREKVLLMVSLMLIKL